MMQTDSRISEKTQRNCYFFLVAVSSVHLVASSKMGREK